MKKNALFIALLSCCLILSGCGDDKKGKKNNTPSISEQGQTSEETSSPEKPSSVDINPPSHGT